MSTYTIWYKTKRRGYTGNSYKSLDQLKVELIKLFNRHIPAVVKDNTTDSIIGRVWKDNNRWNYYIESDQKKRSPS